NETLTKTPSAFFQWMSTNFIAAAAIAVRRQADGGKDVVSLRRFLEEAIKYPHLLSREYYASLHRDPTFPRELIDLPFDEHFGQPGQNDLDKTKLQSDLAELI